MILVVDAIKRKKRIWSVLEEGQRRGGRAWKEIQGRDDEAEEVSSHEAGGKKAEMQ